MTNTLTASAVGLVVFGAVLAGTAPHLSAGPAQEGRTTRTVFASVVAKDGTPVTDGVFPESKEFLAGYWIVDVDGPERAFQIAAQASAAPGPGGAPLNMPIEVRQVMSGPPVEFV